MKRYIDEEGLLSHKKGSIEDQSSPRSVSQNDILIGKRLSKRRVEIGMTQSTLAKAIGVTAQQLFKYEKGINRITGDRLLNAANILQMTVSELLGESDDSVMTASHVLQGSNNFRTKEDILLESYRSLDPKQQAKLMRVIEVIFDLPQKYHRYRNHSLSGATSGDEGGSN